MIQVWKHHNLRIAYLGQHSFTHLGPHSEKSPVDYIKWRFAKGVDREILEKESMQLTAEEQRKLKDGGMGSIEELRNRRTRHGVLEYEVKFKGLPDRDNKYLTKDQLEAMGFGQLVKQADERVAAEQAGLDLRCVSQSGLGPCQCCRVSLEGCGELIVERC
jgi:elongation factor 3